MDGVVVPVGQQNDLVSLTNHSN